MKDTEVWNVDTY